MADDADDDAETPAADATDGQKKPDQDKADDDDQDDLLSSPAFLKQKLKVLQAELEKVEAETAGLKDEAAALADEWAPKRERLATDFENFKARTAQQREDAGLDSKIQMVSDLLPVLDNFDRARNSIAPANDAQIATNQRYLEMLDGIQATLADLGVEKVPTVGEEFDYNLHMAIQQAPSEEYDEGIVCEELQTGYTCKGKLVRAAYVIVAA